jgi:hypothetical protein
MNSFFAANPADIEGYRQRFLDTMAFVARNFELGFRRTHEGKATPRARFEAIAIGSYLALQQRPELASQHIEVEGWLNSKEFAMVTGSDGANAINRLRGRIHFVRDHLLGA